MKPHPSTLISVVESSVHHDQAVVGKDFPFRIAGPIESPNSIQVPMVIAVLLWLVAGSDVGCSSFCCSFD